MRRIEFSDYEASERPSVQERWLGPQSDSEDEDEDEDEEDPEEEEEDKEGPTE